MLDVAYKNKVFEILVQVAKTLISADDVETVLEKVMDLIFEYLPVDRGFLLLEEGGLLKLRVSRLKERPRATSDGSAPYSRTIVDMVMRQKVAVLTSDAQVGRTVRRGHVDPHAADPLGDVRAALEPRLGHRRHPRRLAAPRRELSRSRTSTC